MDWGFVHKSWDKWASLNVGSSGQPLKAAILINYDPTGPSRLLSTIIICGRLRGVESRPMFEIESRIDHEQVRHFKLAKEESVIFLLDEEERKC